MHGWLRVGGAREGQTEPDFNEILTLLIIIHLFWRIQTRFKFNEDNFEVLINVEWMNEFLKMTVQGTMVRSDM